MGHDAPIHDYHTMWRDHWACASLQYIAVFPFEEITYRKNDTLKSTLPVAGLACEPRPYLYNQLGGTKCMNMLCKDKQ